MLSRSWFSRRSDEKERPRVVQLCLRPVATGALWAKHASELMDQVERRFVGRFPLQNGDDWLVLVCGDGVQP
eukprot:CAMPEP_0113262232 /NCGR_PEP_ID=MMETSP0008_2-20120614/17816_1 /TAXON_ID=97485 /ORGANISM="Prymnesium parvum" /LENGTH=71 /DNA_ID=CAMNT_0000110885 /DNA_START=749 /DNA_END=964 /DNA_ORIENTATION=- /assembly_acc=CAM_ASM_000153